MAFWTQKGSALGKDPKRGFRFHVRITNVNSTTDGSLMWYAKTVDKPSLEVGVTEHDYLNHKFRFPGKTTWQPISMKIVDPTSPDMAATFSDLITGAGYHPPSNADDMTSMSKALATTALGNVIISQIDANGQTLERWTLHNAFISKVTYGSLDYSSEDLTEMEIELQYDWAMLETENTDGSAANGAANTSAGRNAFFKDDGSTDPYQNSSE